ncbi:hypothetical protein HDU67_005625 [Dinochytrium kinnereticum]|nr:hypothetical protein HDU67_005625 [Dinochytrium kinnereticum]
MLKEEKLDDLTSDGLLARDEEPRHVPMIKFVGPRSKVAHTVLQTPASPVKPAASASPNVSQVLFYESTAAVPNSFRARPLSDAEMDAVLYGGAVWVEKPKPAKKK